METQARGPNGGRMVRLCHDDEEDPVPRRVPTMTTDKLRAAVLQLVRTEKGFTTQRLAARLEIDVPRAKEIVAELKASGEIKAARGGWLMPPAGGLPTARRETQLLQDTRSHPSPAPGLPARPENDVRFAVDDEGRIVISRGEVALQLEALDVERLDGFLAKSRPLWSGN